MGYFLLFVWLISSILVFKYEGIGKGGKYYDTCEAKPELKGVKGLIIRLVFAMFGGIFPVGNSDGYAEKIKLLKIRTWGCVGARRVIITL